MTPNPHGNAGSKIHTHWLVRIIQLLETSDQNVGITYHLGNVLKTRTPYATPVKKMRLVLLLLARPAIYAFDKALSEEYAVKS